MGEPKTVRLYVGNLVRTISDAALKASLSNFGTVSCFTRNKERNFAHLNLMGKNEKSVDKCISLLHQTRWMGTLLRVEVANEHYMERLQREWTSELDSLKPSVDNQESVASCSNYIEARFEWIGKRTTFVDDDSEHEDFLTNSEHMKEATKVDSVECSRSAYLNGTNETPGILSNRLVISPKLNVAKAFDEAATVDLFGLDYEDGEQEPVVDNRPPKRDAQSKASEEAAKADRVAMNEIGSDPSKIDVSREHDRAYAIISEMFSNNCKDNEVSKSVTIRIKRKSCYTHFMRSVIDDNGSDISPPIVPLKLKLLKPSSSIVSELGGCAHRRKAFYHNIRTLRIV